MGELEKKRETRTEAKLNRLTHVLIHRDARA